MAKPDPSLGDCGGEAWRCAASCTSVGVARRALAQKKLRNSFALVRLENSPTSTRSSGLTTSLGGFSERLRPCRLLTTSPMAWSSRRAPKLDGASLRSIPVGGDESNGGVPGVEAAATRSRRSSRALCRSAKAESLRFAARDARDSGGGSRRPN
eukprot:1558308-Prymnesium_polylepis.1